MNWNNQKGERSVFFFLVSGSLLQVWCSRVGESRWGCWWERHTFEFDLSPSSSSSLSSVRVLLIERVRVSLKLEFDFSSPIGSRLVRTMSTRRRSLGKGKGRKGEMSTGLMLGYLVGWCGEGYWCRGGGEFWGRGRLVESEVVQAIRSRSCRWSFWKGREGYN